MNAGASCGRPRCGGTLDADGYCDECGHAGGAAAQAGPGAAPWRPNGGTPPWRPDNGGAAGRRPDLGGPSAAPAEVSGPTVPSGIRNTRGASGPTGSRPSRRGSGRSSRTSSVRSRLGAGLVAVPPVPLRDPATALLPDPRVAEDKRWCSKCKGPVGRSREGRLGREEGFCPKCGGRFSFRPKLQKGVLVAGQYDVQGCLAHGGLGWIYLAIDRNVEDRWVVLKGLLDSGDADAQAAALAEKRSLAQVNHPNIVSIYNFVQHPDENGLPVGYIVMEYVGGSSLKELLDARRRPDRTWDPLPVGQVIAYALEILPAIGYLHSQGLLYCDFKPDNAIQFEQQLKLIDLGAVIRSDDRDADIFITVGYAAPEIESQGPSPSADINTVGRTMAVLALGMPPITRGKPTPIPADHPVLLRHESFHRLLRRATDPDPLRRFESTDEMADQLAAVLREALSSEDGQPRPAPSTTFEMPRGSFAPSLLTGPNGPGRPDPAAVAAVLPVPLVDTTDPAAGLLATVATTTDRDEVVRVLSASPQQTLELRLRLVRAHLGAGDAAKARTELARLMAEDPDDWRFDWFGGVAALVERNPNGACAAFDTVYSTLPGEMAPKLALAAAAECAEYDNIAGRYYAMVARPDPSLADAAFGQARVRLRAGDRAGAIAALDATPETSSRHVAAQLAAVQATLLGRSGADVGESELRSAARRVEGLDLDPATDHEVRATLLDAAVGLAPASGGPPFLGCAWDERELRLALEGCLRMSARLTSDADLRVVLVDRANTIRPRTWV